MTPSELVAKFLSPVTQKAFAEHQPPTQGNEMAAPALNFESRKKLYDEHGPSLLAKDVQTRIHDLIFGKNVKTLDEAKRLHERLIACLESDLNATKKNSK